MCLAEPQLRNVLTCPHCRKRFAVEDIHRPFRCPKCGAVLAVEPPDFKPVVLYTPAELASGERG
ncbi:MAG: hypothetical protein H0Z19_07450 [Archaeoglobus sp.]|uniref:hypothetical protein n=1 Tax=Archaeoglobus sp. TaxID=1872626 RepID=UPI001DF06620|nr:hypothetical protein [Archaeoglobus sp.]MBO8180300.1 hypothetical protein [Archaeoglobus sp.]